MNKEFKVVQLHGLAGLFLLGFIVAGLVCGFVFFPIWVIMIGWNEIAGNLLKMPTINYYQAFLLWVCLALSSFLVLRNSVSIKVQNGEKMENDDMSEFFDGNITDVDNNEKKDNEN
ncbi:MAG: hypothetical protein GX568_05675 [Candidatus Gastranaerophilales bacterium]|nr:hypothetical protein [Candidatus Gastranaerophilales bacterium]